MPAETAWRSWLDQWAKLGRTLHALLLRPGLLTQEHLGGGRVRYIAPLTLYLNTVALFFVLSALSDFRLSAFLASADVGDLAQMVARRAAAENITPALFLEHADRRFQTIYTLCLSMISVVGYAAIARVFFRRHWQGWRGPITFALHFMAFVFIVYMPSTTLAIKLARSHATIAQAFGTAVFLLGALLIAAWFTLAIRRLFGDPWPWALAKGTAIMLLGIPINTLMWDVAVRVTLMTT
ncbi:MAG: DUF3667 domain-containing protein [Betaproteobacteria bacterium]